MTAYLGLDIGTSAVKAVVVDERQEILGEASVPLRTSRPQPLWSEQDPEDWWGAVEGAVAALRADAPTTLARVGGIGLSGQMHGLVLLDEKDEPIRPAILWNDGRAHAEAEELARRFPALSERVGVLPMPGFPAPKTMWLARHEPSALARARAILLPKDYVRLKLTGERATDMSDGAGTWWLDEAERKWSDEAIAASGVSPDLLPPLLEGCEPAGQLRPEIARAWGMSDRVVVAAGAGDAAAGAVGIGAVEEGSAFLSLGTSGQLFVATASYGSAPETLVHSFCHAVPNRWYQMAAMLNGASCLAWVAGLLGREIGPLLEEVEQGLGGPARCLFLPYLAGERTPHNDPHARGVFFGLSPDTMPVELVQSVLEGVAFSFVDGRDSLTTAGTQVRSAGLIGGGARSRLWARILASALDMPLTRYRGADKGPAFGAARLARIAVTGEPVADVCAPPPVLDVVAPDPELTDTYKPRIEAFRRLYGVLKPEFARA
jgi:xylulokinase